VKRVNTVAEPEKCPLAAHLKKNPLPACRKTIHDLILNKKIDTSVKLVHAVFKFFFVYIPPIELSKIDPEELDDYLRRGWFRMHQSIFTTHQLLFGDTWYEAIWLRVSLSGLFPDKKYRSLQKKNGKFRVEIKKANLGHDLEALFTLYSQSVSFETSPSLDWLLYGNKLHNVYDTFMINVFDENKLIGAGFFDLGKSSAAGICSVYHPAYKKYSLGKYMIYEKMFACKQQNFQYFYPGYFVPGYAPFDYKLEIGKGALEYFDAEKLTWYPIENLSC
jgi:arginine-tRNA-protein transferase